VDAIWQASDLVDEYIGDDPLPPLLPRIAVWAVRHELPVGLVSALDTHLRAHGAADRMDEVLDELLRIRAEAGWPPLAAPIGQILASQALLHVLSASRYQTVVDELRALIEGRWGAPPAPVDAAVKRAVALITEGIPPEEPVRHLDEVREEAEGLAASEEELLLLALFGDEAEPLLRAIRSRAAGDEGLEAEGVDHRRAEQIREIVKIVQESGVAELTIDDPATGLRVTVKRTEDHPGGVTALPPAGAETGSAVPTGRPTDGFVRVEAPMVGTFYRAAYPGAPPFVEVGDAVAPGQTLCILEAMKLMNEVKAEAEALVRAVHVDNASPVEFGQLLFELEPLNGRPLDAV
jgi:oxaloacetate decarboxylase alpha subunit